VTCEGAAVNKKERKRKEMKETNNQPKFQDRLLHCIDCDTDFIFEAGEQLYFASKGLTVPRRCNKCRAMRKASIAQNGEKVEWQ